MAQVHEVNRRFSSGVVLGKFYPPHAGHHALIDWAGDRCTKLHVIVCAKDDQVIPGTLRCDWLRSQHPTATVLLTPDDLPEAPEPWADRVLSILGAGPDAVFTSEEYGDAFARALGCTHVPFDPQREQTPISGTAVRSAPLTHLDRLAPMTRAYIVPRIVFVGAESTGKTTLASLVADALGTKPVPEYGRTYWEERRLTSEQWREDDFLAIALEQQRLENATAEVAAPVLICDTNAWLTSIWHERYLGKTSETVSAIGASDRVHLYIFCPDDFPFVQDGTRDGEEIRSWMSHRVREKLQADGHAFIEVTGSLEDKEQRALSAVERVIRNYRIESLNASPQP